LLWDQTWDFGFRTLDDGAIEVYHRGERFKGPWPVRLVVFLHQRYVLWGAEKYINGDSFGTEDIDAQLDEMACLPLHVFKRFLGRLKAEKARDLEAAENAAVKDEAAIAKARTALSTLDKLAERDKPTISVARRPVSMPGAPDRAQTREPAMKLVVADKETQEALSSAMHDARENRAVNMAMQELYKDPELEFKGRPSSKVRSRQQQKAKIQLSGAQA